MELLVKVVEDGGGGYELVASSIIGQSHQVEHGAADLGRSSEEDSAAAVSDHHSGKVFRFEVLSNSKAEEPV